MVYAQGMKYQTCISRIEHTMATGTKVADVRITLQMKVYILVIRIRRIPLGS